MPLLENKNMRKLQAIQRNRAGLKDPKFAISRLIGAPPGYVGYEEGGRPES